MGALVLHTTWGNSANSKKTVNTLEKSKKAVLISMFLLKLGQISNFPEDFTISWNHSRYYWTSILPQPKFTPNRVTSPPKQKQASYKYYFPESKYGAAHKNLNSSSAAGPKENMLNCDKILRWTLNPKWLLLIVSGVRKIHVWLNQVEGLEDNDYSWIWY